MTTDDAAPGNDVQNQPLMALDDNKQHPLSCSSWTFPSLSCIKYFLILPILVPLSLTMPDVRLAKCRRGYTYPLTFIMSHIWICVMSVCMYMTVGSISGSYFRSLRVLRILTLGDLLYWIIPQLVASVMLARSGTTYILLNLWLFELL